MCIYVAKVVGQISDIKPKMIQGVNLNNFGRTTFGNSRPKKWLLHSKSFSYPIPFCIKPTRLLYKNAIPSVDLGPTSKLSTNKGAYKLTQIRD